MKVRFLADNDLRRAIVDGVLRLSPDVDFRSAQEAGLNGLVDIEVLRLAAADNRVLVTHDGRTMLASFREFRLTGHSPGVLITPQCGPVATAIENVILIWHASDASEWRDRICYLPTLVICNLTSASRY